MKNISIKEAVKFHGHLGPYLILGILAGDLAIRKLRCNKYFGLKVKVGGVDKKPKSCLVDGLQLSTGATYGKGNIQKFKNKKIQIQVTNTINNKIITVFFKKELIKKLNSLKSHKDPELFAKQLYKINPLKIFNLSPNT